MPRKKSKPKKTSLAEVQRFDEVNAEIKALMASVEKLVAESEKLARRIANNWKHR